VTALVALYLNVFVLIVQSFQKVAVLRALAPTQSEPPFLVAQVAALVVFLILGAIATRKFRPAL
jgi:ABC-type polysaccharide/polyol phosphate export permease